MPDKEPIKEETTAEIEGGGSTWWYVCAECRGWINQTDHSCRHCGRPIRKKDTQKVIVK